jgi:hypothetical protein
MVRPKRKKKGRQSVNIFRTAAPPNHIYDISKLVQGRSTLPLVPYSTVDVVEVEVEVEVE